MASSLSLSLDSQYNGLLEIHMMYSFAVCLLGSDELWVYDQIYLFLYPWKYLSFFDLFYAWSLVASYFFFDIWVLFGQLDLFILQWEEVLCSGFDLTVLDPSDRKWSINKVDKVLLTTTFYYHEIEELS